MIKQVQMGWSQMHSVIYLKTDTGGQGTGSLIIVLKIQARRPESGYLEATSKSGSTAMQL